MEMKVINAPPVTVTPRLQQIRFGRGDADHFLHSEAEDVLVFAERFGGEIV
jgi:hypothetical protein